MTNTSFPGLAGILLAWRKYTVQLVDGAVSGRSLTFAAGVRTSAVRGDRETPWRSVADLVSRERGGFRQDFS